MAIAAVLADQVRHLDADVVQIDEANLPGSPDEWPWAAEAINCVLDAVKTIPAVHLCFGNYGGQSIQRGGWTHLMSYLDALHADHVVLETAHRPPEELAIFRDLRPEIGIGLGVVDIKSTEIESADDIARSLERAERVLGLGRIKYINPDCGFWMLKRSIADGKIRALVAGRDLYEGRHSL
jgi:5-methyltetrahydropteroyltriglutamate--homocysteine methyltransferase